MIPPYTDAELARARLLVRPQEAPADTGSTPAWPLVIEDVRRDSIGGKVERMVIADMLARDDYGRSKYGVPLTVDNGRDHLRDAYQEVLDKAAYLKAASLDPRLAQFAGKLGWLLKNCLRDAHEIRLMIARRDGEVA